MLSFQTILRHAGRHSLDGGRCYRRRVRRGPSRVAQDAVIYCKHGRELASFPAATGPPNGDYLWNCDFHIRQAYPCGIYVINRVKQPAPEPASRPKRLPNCFGPSRSSIRAAQGARKVQDWAWRWSSRLATPTASAKHPKMRMPKKDAGEPERQRLNHTCEAYSARPFAYRPSSCFFLASYSSSVSRPCCLSAA